MNSATLLYPETSSVAFTLHQSPLPDLRRLHVEEDEGEVVITGIVSSYYLKQLAQEAIRPVLGIRALRNRVTVAKKK